MTMILLQKTLESQFDTFKKWKRDLDKEFNTVTWLECETVMASGKNMVRLLKCSVCSKYRIRIESSRNFSDKWIVGAEILCTSNIQDHRKNNQHTLAMSLLMKERATSYGQDCQVLKRQDLSVSLI